MLIVWAASAAGSLMIIFQLWPCQIQTDNSHQVKELSFLIMIVYCIIIYLSFLLCWHQEYLYPVETMYMYFS